VNAVHQLWLQKKVDADFKLQQDRILAAIRRIQTESGPDVEERPELADPTEPPPPPGSDLGRLSEAPTPVPTNNPSALPGTGAQPGKPGG